MAPKKRNAFYYYMRDRMPDMEKKLGRRLNMGEMADLVKNDWQSLTEEQRKNYKSKATNVRADEEKYDSRGMPLSRIMKEQEDQVNEVKLMTKTVEWLIKSLKDGEKIHKSIFFFISISYYYKKEDGKCIPAEVGVCKFSFKEGIISQIHHIFQANLPPGSKFEAMQHSDSTHQLPLTNADAEDSFRNFNNQLENLMSNGSAILYTMDEDREHVKSMLAYMTGIKYTVYSSDCLFQNMYTSLRTYIPESIATDMLSVSLYDYDMESACDWHRKKASEGIKYCALSQCRRMCYLVCDQLNIKLIFNITPIDGFHRPKPATVEIITTGLQNMDLQTNRTEPRSNNRSAWANLGASSQPLPGVEDFPPLGAAMSRDSGNAKNPPKSVGRGSVAGLNIPSLGLPGIGRGSRGRGQKNT